MLLAEALAARKDTTAAIDGLRDRLAASVVRYEDEEAPGEAPAELVAELERTLDRFESLTVRINLTNNATRFAFDGRELSVMEGIALRERLAMEAKARRKAVEALDQATGAGKAVRGWLAGRRRKDELRELPTVDVRPSVEPQIRYRRPSGALT